MAKKIEVIIVKYITKSASSEDLDILLKWIEKPKNKEIFKELVKIHYVVTNNMNDKTSKEALDRLLLRIRKEKSLLFKLTRNPIIRYSSVAVILGIISTAFFLKMSSLKDNENTISNVKTKIEKGTNKAVLTLQDGNEVLLTKGTKYITPDSESNGKEIKYLINEKNNSTIEYNYLTIPRGGEFHISLSDGTQVWLNSESQLKYPVNFLKGEIRKVELVYGEAYFDVSASALHNGSKFQVINNGQVVEVLGTEFNIKAYKEESNIYTTLVEGKVAVSYNGSQEYLIPNQQANYDRLSKSLNITNVEVYEEIAWKDGVFVFSDETLKEMLTTLSRWYNIEIEFENRKAENFMFSGVLKREDNINKLLSKIEKAGNIKIEIDENRINIK